jgi:hypothetical protein
MSVDFRSISLRSLWVFETGAGSMRVVAAGVCGGNGLDDQAGW